MAGGFDLAGKRVWVAGHTGMVGGALVRRLADEGCDLLTVDHRNLDLRDQIATDTWLADHRPDAIILAAAKVGGLHANDQYPVDFLVDNLLIATNVIRAAHDRNVNRLLFLGSSCVYPTGAPQPIPASSLLTGPFEPTNEWYATAKLAGLKLTQAYRKQFGRDYITAMPANSFGPGDNFHPKNSHVPAALLSRFHAAKQAGDSEVSVWGTGTPRRDFLYVDDMADACVFLLKHYHQPEPINLGMGRDVSIKEFAELVAETVGFEGALSFDTSKPDGMPRKFLDAEPLRGLGWAPRYDLSAGLRAYYQWFLANIDELPVR